MPMSISSYQHKHECKPIYFSSLSTYQYTGGLPIAPAILLRTYGDQKWSFNPGNFTHIGTDSNPSLTRQTSCVNGLKTTGSRNEPVRVLFFFFFFFLGPYEGVPQQPLLNHYFKQSLRLDHVTVLHLQS